MATIIKCNLICNILHDEVNFRHDKSDKYFNETSYSLQTQMYYNPYHIILFRHVDESV